MDGKRLAQLRKDFGLTQKELAEKLGLTPKAISFYELNQREPSNGLLQDFSRLFNVSVDYLLGLSSNPKLTQEDEIDVYNKFEELKISLENTDDLMFCGEILDDETRELLLSSLKNTILTSKIISNERNKNKK